MLNDRQIHRLIRHVCDSTGFPELTGDIGYFFIEADSENAVIAQCDSTSFGYKPKLKIYIKQFEKLNQKQQIYAIVHGACEAIVLWRMHARNVKPQRYILNKLLRMCVASQPQEEAVPA